jgi:hypothetical protein
VELNHIFCLERLYKSLDHPKRDVERCLVGVREASVGFGKARLEPHGEDFGVRRAVFGRVKSVQRVGAQVLVQFEEPVGCVVSGERLRCPPTAGKRDWKGKLKKAILPALVAVPFVPP